MKKVLFILFIISAISARGQITQKNNAIRSGDTLIKQEVIYKDPGRSGRNVIWDFGKLTPINVDYKVSYSLPPLVKGSHYVMGTDTIPVKEVNPDELIIGNEKEMDYYFRIKDGILFLLGCQDMISKIEYIPAIPITAYKSASKQDFVQPYVSNITYKNVGNTSYQGEVHIETDATGIMILPNKDTLKNVTRTHQVITMLEQANTSNEYLSGSRINCRMEYYRWYVKGYRYPVFETAKHTIIQNGQENDYFLTAFFFPPQKHYYLDNDTTNQQQKDTFDLPFENPAILLKADSIIYVAGKDSIYLPDIDSLSIAALKNFTTNKAAPETATGTPEITWLETNFTYNYFPNPVTNHLTIEYNLFDKATIEISLFKTNGTLIKKLPLAKRNPGLYEETIDCSSLTVGTYLLQIKVNGYARSHVLIKR